MKQQGSLMVYVSADEGSDEWDGSLPDKEAGSRRGPFATLERARQEACGRIRGGFTGRVRIQLRGGVYRLTETLVFRLSDFGQPHVKLTLEAYEGEQPILSGSVPVEGWTKLKDLPPGFPECARNQIWAAEPLTGPSGPQRIKTLYHGNSRIPRARSHMFSPVRDAGIPTEKPDSAAFYGNKDELHVPGGLVKDWSRAQQMELMIYPKLPYAFNILPIASADPERGSLRTTIPGTYPLDRMHVVLHEEGSCWLENHPEFMTEPGRWVQDEAGGKLYYWPAGVDPDMTAICAPAVKELIRIEGDEAGMQPIAGVELIGLVFQQAERDTWEEEDQGLQHDWDLFDKGNALVRFRYAEHCRIDGCTFRCSGGGGLRLDLHAQAHEVGGNTFEHLGGTGILLSGYGPGTLDVNRGNRIHHNRLHHLGELYRQSAGIFIWQSGRNEIVYNELHNLPYNGIVVSGVRPRFFAGENIRENTRTIRWQEVGLEPERELEWERLLPYMHARGNRIACNELYKVVDELGDGNAIYVSGCGEDNIVERNYIHDMTNPEASAAIRTDDLTPLTWIQDNIVARCAIGGITIKKVQHVRNNYIIDLLEVPDKKGNLVKPHGFILLREGPSEGSHIMNNVFVMRACSHPLFCEGRRKVAKAWITECVLDWNVYHCPEAPELLDSKLAGNREQGRDLNSRVGNPFEGGATSPADEFRLKEEMKREMGIRPIHVSEIGVQA